MLEKHHRVRILDEAVESAVKLSHRYIPARQLPDKSVSLLDTACARVAIGQNAIPPRRRGLPPPDRAPPGRDRHPRARTRHRRPHQERIGEVQQELEQARTRLAELEARWNDEKKTRRGNPRALRQTIEARYHEEHEGHAGNGQPFQPSAELAGIAGRPRAPRAAELCASSRASRR